MTGHGGTELLLRNLERVQALFPPGFSPVVECLKVGLDRIELGGLGLYRKVPGSYDAEEKAIRLNPDLSDSEKSELAAGISRRNGVTITAADLFVWVFFHEAAHHLRRRNVLAMSRRNVLGGGLGLAEGEALCYEEAEAESYARRRFLAWKKGRRA